MLTKESMNQTSSFEYDNLNRIVKAKYPTYSEELFYDNAGNRARRVSEGLEELYQYDERNRLVQKTENQLEKGARNTVANNNVNENSNISANRNIGINNNVSEIINYEYDNQGNLLKDNNITYTYDAFNRTTKAETASGNIQINRYDAEGLRHEVEENGKFVQFLYRGKEIVVEKTENDTIRYIRGYGILSSDSEKARTYYHYVSNEANSVTHVTDENSVLNKYEYDAFGNTTTCEEKVHNPFRYRGQQFDAITNQYYLRARYYNPVIGRFTQEDTYHGDGLNLYAYCANNPVKYYDPSGYSKVDAHDNKKALQSLVDEINERGGATPEERAILNSWADEYGVPKDSMGLESQKRISGPTSPSGVIYEGPLYRNVGCIPDGTPVNPLQMSDFTQNQNYRYTEPGINGLYFASNQHIMESEVGNYNTNPYADNRTTYVYDNVSVTNMLDLTNSTVRNDLGINLSDLLNDDYRNFNIDNTRATTHLAGEFASSNGYNGIIAPSARGDGGVNIVIFNPDNINFGTYTTRH
jgi:RHS repeat-associated protein